MVTLDINAFNIITVRFKDKMKYFTTQNNFYLIAGNTRSENTWSVVDCYAAMYRSLLMLGSNIGMDTSRKRISYLSIVLTGMVCYWLWEAQLISYFSFPLISLPFNNLEEFLEKSDNKVYIYRNLFYFFKQALKENHIYVLFHSNISKA